MDTDGNVSMVTVEGGSVSVVSEVMLGDGVHQRRRTRGYNHTRRVVRCAMCDVRGKECVLVMCENGEVYMCTLDDVKLEITSTLVIGSKVSSLHDNKHIMTHNISDQSELYDNYMWRKTVSSRLAILIKHNIIHDIM